MVKTLEQHLLFFETLSARKKDRLQGRDYIAAQPDLLLILLFLAMESEQKRIHTLLIWCIELYLCDHLEQLHPGIDRFLNGLPNIHNESMRRGLAKILHFYSKTFTHRLNNQQKEKIIVQAFDWLIQPAQIATLSFALKILNTFKNHAPWVEVALRDLVEKQLPTASPGYRAAAREILK